MNANRTKKRFTVRKTVSGRTGVARWIVVMNPGGSRVSVDSYPLRESAQIHADDLNISEMVKPHDEDPRPYATRHAEASALYHELMQK